MTVVIGIRCRDGVVIGADGAATFTSRGVPTSQQRSMKKLTAKGTVVTGFAGSLGVTQRVRGEVERVLAVSHDGMETDQILQMMRRQIWSAVLDSELHTAQRARESLLLPGCESSAICELLVAAVIRDQHELIWLNEQGSPTLVQDDVPFVTIGLGQGIADPFVGFTRRMFWPSGLPSLAMGTFSVLWTLRHVIDANSMGLSRPFQLAMLERTESGWKAREMAEEELKEHEERINDGESVLQNWSSGIYGAHGPTPPPPK
jgi:hypothetical protein